MFSKILKQLRSEKHISQSELASALNISNRTISMYEQGNSEPTVETLIKLADFFNVSADYLIGRSEGRLLEDHEIYERLGLNDEAILCLEHFKQISKNNEYNQKQLRNINALLSDFDTLMSISDYLNTGLKKGQYVICNYYVSQNGEDLISTPQSTEKLLNATQWGNMFFSDIQENLIRLRKSITKGTP